MTINLANNNPRIAYSLAQGATQQTFAIPFEFFNNSDVTVYIDGVLKSEGTHYSLTGGDGSTGNVVFNTTVTGATGGSTIVIFRFSDIERTSDFSAGADINRAALNEQLDILTAMIADQNDRTDRTIRVNDYEIAPSLILPTIANRKGKMLAFNATTGAVEGGPTTANFLDVESFVATATAAATSATASATSATASATSAAASFDSFDDRYLGSKTSNPTLDNDGNALLTGALYFNSVSSEMKVYSGSTWVVAYAGVTGLAGGSGSSLVGYNQGGTSAVNRTVQDRLRERISVKDFGAVGDGTTDDTTAIQAAINSVYDAGGGEVQFPYATYITTKPLIVPKGVSLVGRNFNRTLNAADLLPRISMSTATQSTVTEDRASYTQEVEDGFDGVNQTPNAILHLTNTKTTCGEYSGVITGLELEGNSIVAYGIIAKSANYAQISDNEINNVTNGIIILNTSYQANYENNAVRNSARGFYINRGTSQVYTGNFASIYSSYGHKLRDIDYSLYASNAADSGAVGQTASYAYAYKFIDIQNCSIQNNGAEGINGVFMYIDSCQASEFSNNQCISYNLTYTGGDSIGIITLNQPLCIVKNNKITYQSGVTLTPAADRFNILVTNRRSEGNFEVKNNIFAENDGFQTGVPYLFPEAFIRNGSITRPYGLGMATVAQNKTIYVRTTGNNNNSGIATGTALLTIEEAIDRINSLSDIFANITVDIGAGTFAGATTLQYLVGRGSVTFQGAGIASTKLTGSIRVLSCETRVLFTGIEFEPTTTSTWGVRCSTSNVHMYNCAFDGSAASGNRGFLRVDEGGFASAASITINANGVRSCFAENGGHAVLDATLFAAISASFAYADTGGRITKGGIEP